MIQGERLRIFCPHDAEYCLPSKAAQICAAFVVTVAAREVQHLFTRIVSNLRLRPIGQKLVSVIGFLFWSKLCGLAT
jgi:hypothetical protein